MYYAMLGTAAFLFSFQFLFNKKFEEEAGSSRSSSAVFSFLSSAIGFIILFSMNGFKIHASAFSVVMAVFYSVIGILYTIASMKSFEEVNLSAYSVFAMLGGMLLPFLYGIAFRSEGITKNKIVCCVFIITALLFTIDFKKGSGKKIYYIAVFVLNGLTGVCSVIHQTGVSAVDSLTFLMLARAISTIICIPLCVRFKKEVVPAITKNAIINSALFAACCGVGNLLVLISLKHLEASVQYPIITGGVMFLSLIISILRRESHSKREILATATAFVSTIFIAL